MVVAFQRGAKYNDEDIFNNGKSIVFNGFFEIFLVLVEDLFEWLWHFSNLGDVF